MIGNCCHRSITNSLGNIIKVFCNHKGLFARSATESLRNLVHFALLPVSAHLPCFTYVWRCETAHLHPLAPLLCLCPSSCSPCLVLLLPLLGLSPSCSLPGSLAGSCGCWVSVLLFSSGCISHLSCHTFHLACQPWWTTALLMLPHGKPRVRKRLSVPYQQGAPWTSGF